MIYTSRYSNPELKTGNYTVGITPAYAGKRVRCSQQALPRTDHPRMCGEKVSSTSPMKCLKGSPPHVRGKA